MAKILTLALATGALAYCLTACNGGFYKGDLENARLVGRWQAKADQKILILDLREDGSFQGEGIPVLAHDFTVDYLDAKGHWSVEENLNKSLRSRWKLLLRFSDQKTVEKWDLVVGDGASIELRYVTDIDLNHGIRFSKVESEITNTP